MSSEGEEGEGGPHFFRTDIAQLRWAAEGSAVEIINSDPDPLMWPEARMVFDTERALAFGHEGLRDRLSNRVSAELREIIGDLYEHAAEIANTRLELERVDGELNVIRRTWTDNYGEVERDPIELGRYFRHKHTITRFVKTAIAVLFIVSELMLTFKLFEQALAIDNQILLMVFSLGLLTIFVAVPHYAAHGVKEGLTKHHAHLRQRFQEMKVPVPVMVNRNHHMEEQDDKGFRWISLASVVVLILLIVPLSLVRGKELSTEGETILWASLYFLLQLLISSYFFLREWLDHGYPSSTLFKIEQSKAQLEAERSSLLDDLSEQVAEFNTEGQRIAFWIREAPRWDSYIVASYYQTVHHFRHTVAVGRPDLAAFVNAATKPFLGARSAEHESEHHLSSVANDMPKLDSGGLFDREWWMDTASRALSSLPSVQVESGELVIPSADTEMSWILSSSPAQVLAGFLEMLGVPFHYRKPSALPEHPVIDPSGASVVTPPAEDSATIAVAEAASVAASNGDPRNGNGHHPIDSATAQPTGRAPAEETQSS
jgi:hypothetical protein